MSEPSSSCPELLLLNSAQDFQEQALLLISQAKRRVAILSRELDDAIFGKDEFVQAASAFVRSSRYAQLQILVAKPQVIIERNHKLHKLAQRLSSKIELHKLNQLPEDTAMSFMLCDNQGLLYKNDDAIYQGFANPKALVEVKRLSEIFDYLWQHSDTIPEMQILKI